LRVIKPPHSELGAGMLTSNPTIAPDTAKWNGRETLVARKPMANG